ncbi:MAG TPA: hypothetical protein VM186_00670 [Planctomycetota bacterium]|nr:hypothetical protein [Planctomycetota bacterium]
MRSPAVTAVLNCSLTRNAQVAPVEAADHPGVLLAPIRILGSAYIGDELGEVICVGTNYGADADPGLSRAAHVHLVVLHSRRASRATDS